MIKFVVAALWLCAVTVGALFYSYQSAVTAAQASVEEPPSAMMGGLDYVKMEILSVPVVRRSEIQGYFLARLVYTVDPAKRAKMSVAAEALIVDQVYSYLYGNPQIDFSDEKALDLDAFRNGVRDSINARIGEAVIHDVMVEQLDFLSKDEIRDNTIRRKAGVPTEPAPAAAHGSGANPAGANKVNHNH